MTLLILTGYLIVDLQRASDLQAARQYSAYYGTISVAALVRSGAVQFVDHGVVDLKRKVVLTHEQDLKWIGSRFIESENEENGDGILWAELTSGTQYLARYPEGDLGATPPRELVAVFDEGNVDSLGLLVLQWNLHAVDSRGSRLLVTGPGRIYAIDLFTGDFRSARIPHTLRGVYGFDRSGSTIAVSTSMNPNQPGCIDWNTLKLYRWNTFDDYVYSPVAWYKDKVRILFNRTANTLETPQGRVVSRLKHLSLPLNLWLKH